jgi:polysaccharide pyruvyl transferase WcaK-like protein
MTILLLASGFRYARRSSINLGDIAQQQATVERIQERFPRARILAVANSVNDVPSIPGVDISYALVRFLTSGGGGRGFLKMFIVALRSVQLLWNARRLRAGGRPVALGSTGENALRVIADADGLVLSGAGAFNDYFGASRAAIWALVMRVAVALGKPVVVSGQQIGPLSKWLPRAIAGWGLRAASVVGVRDPISARKAVELGILPSKVVLTGDDAWDLKAADLTEVVSILRKNGISEKFVSAQVRFDRATQWTSADAPNLAKLIDYLCTLSDAPALFVRTHYASDQDDLDAAKAVQAHMKSDSYLMEDELSPAQTKALLAAARAGIGVSYHFCVFSCSSRINTFGLYRSPYMEQKMLGLAELCPAYMVGVSLSGTPDLTAGERRLEEFINRARAKGRSQNSTSFAPRCQSTAALDALVSQLGIGVDR